MNTTPTTTDRITLMTHDGLSLLLSRTFSRLSEVIRMHHNRIMEATKEDYDAMFRNPDIAPTTLVQLDELMASLTDARAELLEIEDYWNSIPWTEMFAHPDPRVPQDGDVHCDLCVECVTDALREALRDRGEVSKEVSEMASGFEAHMTASDALDLAQAVERQRIDIEGKQPAEDKVNPGRAVVVGPPSQDFEPSLLAAKRVLKVDVNNDVRTKTTVGKANVEWEIGGPPVIWLHAVDGTRVAVLKEDVAKLAEVFTRMA
jgi:hypothetical protein